MQQGRWELAERELQQAIAHAPDAALPHALYSLCLTERDEYKPAADAARHAIGLDPELDYAHFALARALLGQNKFKEADTAIAEAQRLDPYDADYCGLRALIQLQQERPKEALATAERGLSIAADHTGCLNIRAMALVKLGRRDEAGQTIKGALARDPENTFSHANLGWTLLHQDQPAAALEHFREALRLDATNEFARAGMVEALKARYLIYRVMLRYFLFMSRLSSGMQWVVIIGMWVGYRLLREVSRKFPEYWPVLLPLLLLAGAFILMTWLAEPIFSLLLRFSKYGRYALSDRQRVSSNWLAGLLVAALATGIAAAVTGSIVLIGATVALLLLLIPVTSAAQTEEVGKRRILWAATAVLAALPLAALAAAATNTQLAMGLVLAFVVGCALFSWLANVVRMSRSA